jgi:hypothetical protein
MCLKLPIDFVDDDPPSQTECLEPVARFPRLRYYDNQHHAGGRALLPADEKMKMTSRTRDLLARKIAVVRCEEFLAASALLTFCFAEVVC